MITIVLPATPITRTMVETTVIGKTHGEADAGLVVVVAVLTSNKDDEFEEPVCVSSAKIDTSLR
jgi:hypothetical protein